MTYKGILNNSRGFTLFEVLIVLIIVALLATIAVTNYISLHKRTQIRSAEGNMLAIDKVVSARISQGDFTHLEGSGLETYGALLEYLLGEIPNPKQALSLFYMRPGEKMFFSIIGEDSIKEKLSVVRGEYCYIAYIGVGETPLRYDDAYWLVYCLRPGRVGTTRIRDVTEDRERVFKAVKESISRGYR